MNLVEKNLAGVGAIDGFNLVGKDLIAFVREISVEVDVVMNNAGVG